MRGRSCTASPTCPRRDLSSSLFVRNLSYDCSKEDLRKSFKQFGPLKDIYLPRDHHTGDPRGFGFVQFVDPADAAEAEDHMDGYVLLGRKLTVVFARQCGDGRSISLRKERYDRRRSYSRSPANNGSRSRSISPARSKSRSISRIPRRNRSPSPRRRRNTPVPARRNRSRSPRRRRNNTPVPASRNRSRRLRRRSNTPLPARSRRSPRTRRRRSNTPLPASRNRSPRPRRRRNNTPVPARSCSPRGEQ